MTQISFNVEKLILQIVMCLKTLIIFSCSSTVRLSLPLISRSKVPASQFITLRSHSISSRVAHEIIFLGKRKRFARSFPSSSSRGSSSRDHMIVRLVRENENRPENHSEKSVEHAMLL